MKTTKIRVLFLSVPKETALCAPMYRGEYSSEALAEQYMSKLSACKTEDVEFTGNNIIRHSEELETISEQVKGEDGILAFILGLFPSDLQRTIVGWGMPTIMVNPTESPLSTIPWLGNFCWIQGKSNVIPVLSSDFADVVRKIGVLKAISKLGQTKVLHSSYHPCPIVGRPEECKILGVQDEQVYKRLRYHGAHAPGLSEDFMKQAKEIFGLDLKSISSNVLAKAYDDIAVDVAGEMAQRWIEGCEDTNGMSRQDILDSCRLYYAIKQVMDDENAQAITELGICMGAGPYPLPCLAFAQINNEGLAGICQNDLSSTITQLMVGYLTDRPGFVGHLHVDTARNLIGIAHDTCPTGMEGRFGEKEPYSFLDHGGLLRGTCLNVKLKEGQKVTVATFIPFKKMMVFTGVIDHNVDPSRTCRTHVAVKVKNAKRLLRSWLSESYPSGPLAHRVLFYGDWIEEVRDLGQMLGFEVVDELE